MTGIALSFERKGRALLLDKKEPDSHFYMRWAQRYGNYHNLLTHTLNTHLIISLEVLFLLKPILLELMLLDFFLSEFTLIDV